MSELRANLSILPSHQRALWSELGSVPSHFVLYGGTAIALRLGRVGVPDRAAENGVWIASLLDLAGTKAAVIQQRAEAKDYLDLHAIIRSGITLELALAAARAMYGTQFNPAITLKALAYYGDGDLAGVPSEVQTVLINCATRVGVIPDLPRLSDLLRA